MRMRRSLRGFGGSGKILVRRSNDSGILLQLGCLQEDGRDHEQHAAFERPGPRRGRPGQLARGLENLAAIDTCYGAKRSQCLLLVFEFTARVPRQTASCSSSVARQTPGCRSEEAVRVQGRTSAIATASSPTLNPHSRHGLACDTTLHSTRIHSSSGSSLFSAPARR